MTTSTRYAIVYGSSNPAHCTDYTVGAAYDSAEEAAASYDPDLLIDYGSGHIGGAEVVEIDSDGNPGRCVRTLVADS